jgi:ubiquinone/menaquinone biosynthesis C-methylase UbiE
MKHIDYDQISQIYDDVRRADLDLINAFLERIQLDETSRVLDIGCGTGNYTALLQKLTRAQLFGVDPSNGMLEKARQKNPQIAFRQAEAASLPFARDFFDFSYMTDVIHHIPDIAALFTEIGRVLKPGCSLCIVTQSHQQIAARPIAQFFPGTIVADQRRYPDIPAIIQAGQAAGLVHARTDLSGVGETIELSQPFLELVREKGYSMLHLISQEEYAQGLQALEQRLQAGPFEAKAAGESLVWLYKLRSDLTEA